MIIVVYVGCMRVIHVSTVAWGVYNCRGESTTN